MNSVTILVTLLVIVPIALVLCEDPNDYDDVSQVPSFLKWDFIVVGAGAAGSVVAGRLAEETSQTVLLLEGGAKGTGQREIGGDDYVAASFKTDPATGQQRRGEPLTRYDVPTMADSIRIASNELQNMWPINATGFFFQQAKVVGGNQATNGLQWTVPRKADFDGWNLADYTGAKMWPYLKRIENATETGYGNSTDRGTSGRTNVRFATFIPLEQYRFQNACISAGYGIGGDYAEGSVAPNKTYQSQLNVKRGIRQSTSILYLPEVLQKNNFTPRPSAVVTRVLFNSTNHAIGVEYFNEITGQKKQVYAKKEVILAAGDLLTAKILFNSGIGPLSTLTAFGKPLRVVNNMIGQKIRNHQRVTLSYSDRTLINANFYNYPSASVQYARTGEGILESRGLFVTMFNSGIGAPTPNPDLNAIAGLVAGATPTSVYTQSIGVTVGLQLQEYANGTTNLTSPDPLAPTSFRGNLFAVDEDAQKVARGILEARRIMSFWNGTAVELTPGPNVTTMPQLVSWIRANAGSTCHYYGSAPMGETPDFPTDTKMLVKGVTGLRLVGPAVIPNKVFYGMQPLAIALGEKGTDLIKAKWNL